MRFEDLKKKGVSDMNKEQAFLSPEWFREEAVKYADTDAEMQQLRKKFCEKFSPERLAALSGKELLYTMFGSKDSGYDSLSYTLEFAPDYFCFGSIKGGAAGKFGLYYGKDDHCWHKGMSNNEEIISEADAITEAESMRYQLLMGLEIVRRYRNVDDAGEYHILEPVDTKRKM